MDIFVPSLNSFYQLLVEVASCIVFSTELKKDRRIEGKRTIDILRGLEFVQVHSPFSVPLSHNGEDVACQGLNGCIGEIC
jgi:hypothetical protein